MVSMSRVLFANKLQTFFPPPKLDIVLVCPSIKEPLVIFDSFFTIVGQHPANFNNIFHAESGSLGGAFSAAAFREMALSYFVVGRINFASLEANLGGAF